MHEKPWLENRDNQTAVYAICERAVTSLAPEEVPLMAEIFPDYVTTLLQHGDVAGGAEESGAFGFSGESDLTTLFVIPFAIDVLNTLLLSYGIKSLYGLRAKWQERRQSVEEENVFNLEQMRAVINQSLADTGIVQAERQELADALTTALAGYLRAAG